MSASSSTIRLQPHLVAEAAVEMAAAGVGASHEDAEIRPCNRVRADVLPKFLKALDDAGMLAAFRVARDPPGAFFSVRKEWCAERQVWIQRLVLDRRPRNAQEQQLTPPEDTVPHGSAFIELQLDPQNVVARQYGYGRRTCRSTPIA